MQGLFLEKFEKVKELCFYDSDVSARTLYNMMKGQKMDNTKGQDDMESSCPLHKGKLFIAPRFPFF